MPVVACYIGGITRDNNRVFNKIAGTYNEVADGRFLNEKQPLPIDLTVNVSVMTRYQADMDQILSHLLPYINPYFVVSWRTPSRPDFEIRSNVYWNGTANIQYPTDLNSTQVARVVADLSFVFKGWIFQALPNDVIGSVYSINSTYALSNNLDYSISYDQFKLDMLETDSNYDQITYQGTPPQPTVIEPSWGNTGKNIQFNLFGRGFKGLQNVYLSGAPFQHISTMQNPFSGVSSLSSDYSNFFAAKLDKSMWTSNYDNSVSFVTPSAANTGRMDVILENIAGWDTLTHNVRINNFNPFETTMLSGVSFIPYQLPYLSGVEFFNQNN